MESIGLHLIDYGAIKKKPRLSIWSNKKMESFVKNVQPYPVLYNKKHPEFKDTITKKRIWAAIGLKFNCSGEEAYQRWITQRDRYNKERNLMQAGQLADSNGDDGYTTKWKLYNLLDNILKGLNQQKFEEIPSIEHCTKTEVHCDSSNDESPACQVVLKEEASDLAYETLSPPSTSSVHSPSCSTTLSSDQNMRENVRSPSPDWRRRKTDLKLLSAFAKDFGHKSSSINRLLECRKSPSSDDEISYFCKRLEARIRKLNKPDAHKAMRQVDLLMYDLEAQDVYMLNTF